MGALFQNQIDKFRVVVQVFRLAIGPPPQCKLVKVF